MGRGAGEGTKSSCTSATIQSAANPSNIFKGPIASDTSRFAGKDTIDRSDADVQTGDVTLVIDELVNQLVEAQPAASREDALRILSCTTLAGTRCWPRPQETAINNKEGNPCHESRRRNRKHRQA